MSDSDLQAKFFANGRGLFSDERLRDIVQATESIDLTSSIGNYMSLLRKD
jgi:hypothetical protein